MSIESFKADLRQHSTDDLRAIRQSIRDFRECSTYFSSLADVSPDDVPALLEAVEAELEGRA